jgi:hypothetical protein
VTRGFVIRGLATHGPYKILHATLAGWPEQVAWIETIFVVTVDDTDDAAVPEKT